VTGLEGILFDCDGVLFESRDANLAFYNRILEQFGEPGIVPEESEKAHLCHTAASPEVFEALLGPERADQARAYASTVNFRQFIPFMKPAPGIYDALHQLSARLPLGVATNRGNSMQEILDHFAMGRFFSVVVTSRDVLRPKPHPDMLFLAAERMEIDPENLLFVGDSELDEAAAATAGVRFVGYGAGAPGETVVRSHGELLDWIRRSNGGT